MRPYIIAIDFDETICANGWPDITQGVLIDSTIDKMRIQLEKNPYTDFILWTVRANKSFMEAVNFCKRHALPIKYFNEEHPSSIEFRKSQGPMPPGKLYKIYADEYWDDRAVHISD